MPNTDQLIHEVLHRICPHPQSIIPLAKFGKYGIVMIMTDEDTEFLSDLAELYALAEDLFLALEISGERIREPGYLSPWSPMPKGLKDE